MCIFCKIVNGEIPSYKIFEDNDFIAILDISQATKGHSLIIPKKHYESLYDLSDDLSSKIILFSKKVASILKTKYPLKGLNLLQNNGEIAGQTVMHFHLHLIPRYENNDIIIELPNHHDLVNLAEIHQDLTL